MGVQQGPDRSHQARWHSPPRHPAHSRSRSRFRAHPAPCLSQNGGARRQCPSRSRHAMVRVSECASAVDWCLRGLVSAGWRWRGPARLRWTRHVRSARRRGRATGCPARPRALHLYRPLFCRHGRRLSLLLRAARRSARFSVSAVWQRQRLPLGVSGCS